ncbi:MAG: SDR family NAD(P)-dependent oxidoreductase [Bacteroidota bacterium]
MAKQDKKDGTKRKLVLITGGTAGIGKQAALDIAATGADVIIVGRNEEKGETARADIAAKSPDVNVTFIAADLSEQSHVRRLASTIAQDFGPLDVLLNNVGHIFTQRQLTSDGIERTLALNHMCSFLLTRLLLPRLKAAPEGRIVNVSSGMHHFGRFNQSDLQSTRNFNGWAAYGSAKLYNIIWSHQLALDLEPEGITVNVADPLMTMSDNMASLFKIFGPLKDVMVAPYGYALDRVMPIHRATWPLVHLATSPKMAGVTRQCLNPSKRFVRSSIPSYSKRRAEKVMGFSEELLKVLV